MGNIWCSNTYGQALHKIIDQKISITCLRALRMVLYDLHEVNIIIQIEKSEICRDKKLNTSKVNFDDIKL